MKQTCFEQKRKGKKKNDVLFRWGQVLYLLPYRFFLSSKRMPPQPFPTLYINSCSLSLHPPRIHKADTKKKKKNSYHCAQAGSQFVKRCKCFSILLNYWNKPKIDVKRLEGDVTEKDNVLLSLCCSKNSMTNRTRRKEGFFLSTETSLRLTFILASYGCSASVAVLIWDLRVEDEIRMSMRRWRRGEGQSSW